MKYEWYSGSGSAAEVPRRIEELDSGFAESTPSERVSLLRGILADESEPNWRGYLLYRIAMNLLDAGSQEDAVRGFQEALAAFDPLSPTFDDVFPDYAGTVYFLIKEHLFEAGQYEAVVVLGSLVTFNAKASELDEQETALLVSYLGLALTRLAGKYDMPLLHQEALNHHLTAHFLARRDPDFLERLVYAYFNVGDAEGCRRALGLFEALDPPGELRDRMTDFVRHKLALPSPESDPM